MVWRNGKIKHRSPVPVVPTHNRCNDLSCQLANQKQLRLNSNLSGDIQIRIIPWASEITGLPELNYCSSVGFCKCANDQFGKNSRLIAYVVAVRISRWRRPFESGAANNRIQICFGQAMRKPLPPSQSEHSTSRDPGEHFPESQDAWTTGYSMPTTQQRRSRYAE